MKRLIRRILSLPKALLLFIAVTAAHGALGALRSVGAFLLFLAFILALSAFGGYQLYHMTYRVNDFSLQRADQMLAIQDGLDEAAIELGGQIQEGKDMLLRVGSDELYAKHRAAFIEASVGVQKALLRARSAMYSAGLDAAEVERLGAEHKALLSRYVAAQGKLSAQRLDSARLVDRQVIGADRELQRHIAAVRADVALLAKQQLAGTEPSQGRQYLVLGLLGTSSLLFMALVGFAFASRLHGPDSGTRLPSYS